MHRTEVKETLKNLRIALKEELKHEKFFLRAAEKAKEEGLSEAAEFFRKTAKEEKAHSNQIEILLKNLI
ncbi:MAG: ferritin family protein [Candidatus Pacearchaeota archaeon]